MNPFVSEHLQKSLVLASASPRRRELLERLGFEFEVIETSIDENELCCEDDTLFAMALAEMKAREGLRLRPDGTIIAADTIVVCEGNRLGKPADKDEAGEMLKLLSGRMHYVVTGLALFGAGERLVEAERTAVYFKHLEKSQIERYLDTGEPFGKAGAYAIQGYGALFIEKIEGCYFNVVGLPISRLFDMFARLDGRSR